jgi:SAM-dependent methyltransferase
MTRELALLFGDDTRVIAFDISQEQLDLAGDYRADADVENRITFVQADLTDLAASPKLAGKRFDLIYTRFTLTHMANPDEALKNLLEKLKPGGYIVCEDMLGYDGIFGCPGDPAMDDFIAYAKLIPRIAGVEFLVGRRLPEMLEQQGLEIVAAASRQPLLREREDMRFWTMPYDKVFIQNCVNSGVVAREKLERIIDALNDYIDNRCILISWAQFLQICGRKAE